MTRIFSIFRLPFLLIMLLALAACNRDLAAKTPLLETAVSTPIVATTVPSPTATPSPIRQTAVPLTPSPTIEPATSTPLPTPARTLAFPDYDCPAALATAVPAPPSAKIAVVFVGTDGIYRWQEAVGQSELIFPANNVTALKISDDGQRVAFTQENKDDAAQGIALWVMDSDGENGRELLSADDVNSHHASENDLYLIPRRLDWVPGSHTLAYTTIGHRGGLLAEFYDDLHLIDVDSGAVTTLLPPGTGGDFYYAPDGTQIALVNDSSLSLVNSDGSNLRPEVLSWQPLGLSHEYHRPSPNWLPDSTALLIATSNAQDNIDADYNPDASATIWRVQADGTTQQLTTAVGAPLGPAFSPDGRQMMFERVIDDELTYELHIAAVDNSWNIVYVVSQGMYGQDWLPDNNGFIIRVNREAPLLGRLCQPPFPLPLPETPDSFVRRIEWIDSSRFLFTIDKPPQLLLGDLDGMAMPVGSLRQEYFFGVGALTAFDFSFVE
ncbi:MAG: PD40 domain-containing protein [Anaerolineales bacterium]|nr:PD40 domain-containing protein [Anaerolineales bacterium]